MVGALAMVSLGPFKVGKRLQKYKGPRGEL
jgi:hypothetical protein